MLRAEALLAKNSGNVLRVGILLDFVRLATRALNTRVSHGVHVRRTKRKRIGRHSRVIERPLLCSTRTSRNSRNSRASNNGSRREVPDEFVDADYDRGMQLEVLGADDRTWCVKFYSSPTSAVLL